MGTPRIEIQGLGLSYDGRRRAVDDVHFRVEPGSIFALVGPNGAGKTSTLRMLATLTPPTVGAIRIDGIDAAAHPDVARRHVGYLPDHFALYEAMTPVDYLGFFARCHGVPEGIAQRRTDALLEELNLSAKRAEPIRALSRGMRQRLGLAKTLIHDPTVLLLDEPASALDPDARLLLKDTLQRLARRGLAIVISSHILPDLADLADAVGIMEGGRMIHAGPIAEVARAIQPAVSVFRLEILASDARPAAPDARDASHPAERHHRPEQVDLVERLLAGFGPRLCSFEALPCDEVARYDVWLSGGDAAVADLLEALVLRGVRVRHFAPRESAIESLYRASAARAVA